jgi:hypothetical protein
MKHLQTIGIHGMFLNVATLNQRIGPYLLQKKRLVFLTFLPNLLMTI